MKSNSAQILKKSIILALALVCLLTFGIAFSQIGSKMFAKADTVAPVYTVGGWTEYGGESVSLGTGGIVMESGAEGYSFSNTTKTAYNTNDLSISIRLKDYIFDPASAATNFFIGLTPADANFAAEDGSSYGVALMSHTDNSTFNAWLVKRNKEATSIPGWDNLALVGGNNVKTSSTGVLTIDFHRESNGQWYIWINGIYQIDVSADANAAFDAQAKSHVAIVASDNFGASSAQTAKVEVISIASDVLGKLNENSAITNRVANSSYQMTENGVVFNSTYKHDETNQAGYTDIQAAAQEKMAGKLDGAVLSFKREVSNAANYTIDVGFSSYHGAGRFTFWDSWQDLPGVTGCFAMRIAPNNTVTFLMITRSATSGYEEATRTGLYGGALAVPVNAEGEYIIQLIKVENNWAVLVNGRKIFSTESNYGDFQTFLNNTMESINNSPENISPYVQIGDATGKTEGYSASITVKGYGTQRWGKIVDVNEGVMGDEISGELEFNKNDWTAITPQETTVDVKINEEGFVLKGRNEVTGFNMGMNYKTAISTMDGYSVTVKMPETILQSGGATKGWYGMFIGDTTLRNFADINCIYIRWRYESSTSAASTAVGDLIVWNGTTMSPITSCGITIPAKTAEGKTTEVTVRFVYNTDDAAYRIYANGTRISTPAVEEAMTTHLNAMQNKYLTVNASYEVDGGTAAWVDGDEGKMQEITIVSVCGKKIVNNAPELVTGAITVAGTATDTTITLTWTKAEYPVGNMDSYGFTPVGYVIERYNATDELPEETITVDGDIDTLTYTDTELVANSPYWYTVYAVDENGNRLISSDNKPISTEETPTSGGNEGGNQGGNEGGNQGGDEGGNEGGNQGGDNQSGTTENKGCGSLVGTSAIALSVIALAGACVACKKKR